MDFISESVPEGSELKGNVFGRFHMLCPERTVFTTNTSMLVPLMFAQATGRPEKLVALHFHDLRANNIADVMPHPGTDPEVTQLVHDFAVSIGQIVIMLHREHSGYVFNSMPSSLFSSALTLASRNIASIEDIDRSCAQLPCQSTLNFCILREEARRIEAATSLTSAPRPKPPLTTAAAMANRRRTKITTTAVKAMGMVPDSGRCQMASVV